jgi:cytochrome b6-f complex iron-sulfur subunit
MTPTTTLPAPGQAPAKPVAQKSSPASSPRGVTRREFLYYVWGASMALFLAETAGISVLFALPRFREGEFGGKIAVNASDFPAAGAAPVANNLGKFWMVTTEQGVMALYKVCTHLGCIFAWDALGNRFACPCHGSQFQYDGSYMAGPAPRSLDRFALEVYDQAGNMIAESPGGDALPLPVDAAVVRVHTGMKALGKSHF